MKIIKRLIATSVISCVLLTSAMPVMATSVASMKNGPVNFKGSNEWMDSYDAPTLHIEIKDSYERKGEQEKFEIELINAKWVEEENTTLTLSEAEGIGVADGYVSPISKTKAEVVINIPKSIEQGEIITFDIPLLIKVKDGVDEINLSIKEKDEKHGLIDNTTITVAMTSAKKLTWQVGEVTDISGKGVIAPLTFTETKAGVLGSREIEILLEIQNDDIYFDEPEYETKNEYNDTIEYYVDLDKYLEYSGGFTKEGQKLKITINKDEKTMRVNMQGSVPSSKGIMTLKNIPIKGDSEEVQDVKLMVYSEEITNSRQVAVVAHYEMAEAEEVQEEITEEIQEESQIEDTTQEEEVAKEKQVVKFKVGEEKYTIDETDYKMDGKTYVKTPGYTMVPVRYVAEALGAKNMIFANGKVSFDYENTKVQLTVGSQNVIVNGNIEIMEVPLEVVDHRIYAPIGEVAKLLKVDKQWDAVSQSALFIKE